MVASSSLLYVMTVLLWSVLPVTVQTNAGRTIEGNLLEIKTESIVVSQGTESVEIAVDDINRLEPAKPDEKTPPRYRVTLVGGSKIQVQDVRSTESDLIAEPAQQNALRVPIKQVKAIRFRAPSQATDGAWFGTLEREARGDSLVIRRPGNKLDSQQGVVVGIEDGSVEFDLDGTVVKAPIDRLEGIVFGNTGSGVENSEVQVADIWGSEWSAVGVAPSQGEQPLQLLLSNSLKHEIPLYQISSIRWSGGVTYLAGLTPVSESVETEFKTTVDTGLLRSFFGIRPVDEQNLSMVGGSEVEYRIEPGYRLFAGSMRLNASPGSGKVTVRVALDGKQVWEELLDPSAPRGFELPLDDARRLTIAFDGGPEGDTGDRVLLIRPRLLK